MKNVWAGGQRMPKASQGNSGQWIGYLRCFTPGNVYFIRHSKPSTTINIAPSFYPFST